ncbi:MAG: hypothetical protein AAF502_07110 [Bacteroidota bacterium]
MGYTSQSFAVDLQKIRNMFGSGDHGLLEKVKTSNLYEHYADTVEPGEFEALMSDIFIRYIPPEKRKTEKKFFGLITTQQSSTLNPDYGYAYGYALLVICDAFGQHLTPQGDIFYFGSEWKKISQEFSDKGFKVNLDKMWEPGNVFDIPPIGDFPVINSYSKKEISYLVQNLENFEIDDNLGDIDGDEFDEYHVFLKALRDGLLTCQKKDVEWVSFIH